MDTNFSQVEAEGKELAWRVPDGVALEDRDMASALQNRVLFYTARTLELASSYRTTAYNHVGT